MIIDYPLYVDPKKLKELEEALAEQGRILKSIKFYPKNRVTVMTAFDPMEPDRGDATTKRFSFDDICNDIYGIFEQARDWEEGMRYMTHYENMRWW
jgi:hypothetical protein